MKGLHIFQAGRHESMDGSVVTLADADVAATAAAYDPKRHEAPVVIGHPRLNEPAYGWVERLASRGGGLYADVRDVDPSFAETVRTGRYRKLSASFYRPGSTSSPTPEVWALRHVGFLGAAAPAVKGLRPVELGEDDGSVATFADALTGAPAEDRELDLRRREAELLAEGLVRAGRLTPGARDLAVSLMASMADTGLVTFAEHDGEVSETPAAAFRRFLERLPVTVHFAELSRDVAEPVAGVTAPDGFSADPKAMELHRRAVGYQRQHKVDYPTAVRAVASGTR